MNKLFVSKLLVLKGIAIVGVLVIHFVSSIKTPIFYNGWQFWALFFDQLSRFCVPLFVALSGYTLMAKYGQSLGNVMVFWWRRISKLIPLYVWWCLIITLAIMVVPEWQWEGFMSGWWQKVMFGYADYHFYFVPMIFQLYLVFPVVAIFVRKSPKITLLLTGIWHLFLLSIINSPQLAEFLEVPFVTDQLTYLFFGTWIWFFILGMVLAHVKISNARLQLATLVIAPATFLMLFLSVLNGKHCISQEIDPIFVTKFTNLPISFYATGFVLVSLFWLKKTVSTKVTLLRIWQPLIFLGTSSYLIYLNHTLVYRMMFSYYYELLQVRQLVLPLLLFVVGVTIPYVYTKMEITFKKSCS